ATARAQRVRARLRERDRPARVWRARRRSRRWSSARSCAGSRSATSKRRWRRRSRRRSSRSRRSAGSAPRRASATAPGAAGGWTKHDLVYLFLDAVYLKLRPDDTPAEGVLVAWGVTL